MDDDEKTIIGQVFGDSSDGEDYQPTYAVNEHNLSPSTSDQNGTWERIEDINGLWLCSDFLSPQHQSSLLSEIENEGWFTEGSHNQAMRFGDLPTWAIGLSNSIRDRVLESMDFEIDNGRNDACLLPPELAWREPLFDQLIVNVYQPSEGICAHVDLMRFEDGIAIVSLESPCIMHFSSGGDVSGTDGDRAEIKDVPGTKVPVYLAPGSLVLLSGEARYLWKHEINRKPGFQTWEGQEIDQKRRTSITLRRLCRTS